MTEVTLSSENMKLSYFQKILFYEPRPKGGGFMHLLKPQVAGEPAANIAAGFLLSVFG